MKVEIAKSRLVRINELIERTGLSKSELYRRQKNDPDFPKSIPIGLRSVAWIEAEIDGYLADLIAQRDARRRSA